MFYCARSPVRLSFAGGGTDVSPYCNLYGGLALNLTISKFTWVSIAPNNGVAIHSIDGDEKYPSMADFIEKSNLAIRHVAEYFSENAGLDSGFEIHLRNDVPGMSGLGGSASFFVSAINAFNHLTDFGLNKYEIAEAAFDLERKKLGNMGGRQDQYASSFGGVNFLEFKGDDFVRVNHLQVKPEILLELEKRLVLINLGKRKKSGDIISDQIRRVEQKDKESLSALDVSKKTALEMKSCLMKGELDEFAKLFNLSWEQKKHFSSLITNPYIDSILDFAKKNGADAGKITGAGGGGHMLLLAKPNQEEFLKKRLSEKGHMAIPFTFHSLGAENWAIK